MSKHEIRNKFESPNSNVSNLLHSVICLYSDFEFVSDFDIRISDFAIRHQPDRF
jgi:hypothetical protein